MGPVDTRAAPYATRPAGPLRYSGVVHSSESKDCDQKAYTTILTNWISEMVIGSRIADYPHHSSIYS